MSYILKKTQHIRDKLSQTLGETTAKTYFSYYGIFKDGLMIGLYKNNQFYLRIAEADKAEIAANPDTEALSDPTIRQNARFYLLPEKILNHLTDYHDWFKHSLAELKLNKCESYYQRKKYIRSLPNMSIRIERLLKKVNIFTIEDLMQRGDIETFVDLIKIGEDIDHILLFKLHGAIQHQFIYTLSKAIKNELIMNVDQALYRAGLRKRFNTLDTHSKL